MTGSDRTIRERYADLLDDENDPGDIRLLAYLEAGYTSVTVPPALERLSSGPTVCHAGQADAGRTERWRIHTKVATAVATVAVGIILLATAVTTADQHSIIDLGTPAPIVSTNSGFPLSGFHRVSAFPRLGKKPELLFLAAQVDTASTINVERWPVVKALSQFGRLSGIAKVDKHCTTVASGQNTGQIFCSVPTYDFTHVHYASPYLTFVSKDLVRRVGFKDRAFQPLTPAETAVYTRYVRSRTKPVCTKHDASGNPIRYKTGRDVTYTCTGYVDYVDASFNTGMTRTFPLIAIGDYLQTLSQDMIEGDFAQPIAVTPSPYSLTGQEMLSFDTDRRALVTGKEPYPSSRLVTDVNGEANIITALICHATKNRPASVCHRATIKQILKYVK